MTTQNQANRQRSPAYPAVPLETAVESARKLWNAQRKQDAHIDSALKSLGYTARSGTAMRAIASLNQYGLIEESGAKDARKVRLSGSAQDILLLDDSDSRRQEALKKAALLPTIHAALRERYGAQLPDDALIKPYLTRDKNYNESVVDTVLANYRTTLEFARLDKIEEGSSHDEIRDTGENSRTSLVSTQIKDTRETATMTGNQELPILVGASNRVARIPFPMSEDDFDLLIGTLNLWKKKLLSPKPAPDAKSDAGTTTDIHISKRNLR